MTKKGETVIQNQKIVLTAIYLIFLTLNSYALSFDVNGIKDPSSGRCAKEGEKYSGVYQNYPAHCCPGMTEWASGMDSRISIGDQCYDTGLLMGSPIGTCISCGNGICNGVKNPCNCPQDCKNGSNATYSSLKDFCSSDRGWRRVCQDSGASGLPVCKLCTNS